MSRRDFLRQLEELNLLKIGYKLGMLTSTSDYYSEIYDYWENLQPVNNKNKAAQISSLHFRITERTVWRAVKSMKTKIDKPMTEAVQ